MRRLLFLSVPVLLSAAWLVPTAAAQRVIVKPQGVQTHRPVEIVRAPQPQTVRRLNVISAPNDHPVSLALAETINTFAGDPDPFVRVAVDLYKQTQGHAIWYRAGGWTESAIEAYRILDQAAYDGLPRPKYLKNLRGSLTELRTNKQVAATEFMFTVGMLKFAMDLKFGLQHDVKPGEIGEAFKDAYREQRLTEWIDEFRPDTPLYLRLHKALLLGELTEDQSHKAALTMHRERTPLMVDPKQHVIVDIGLQELKVYEDRKELFSMPVVVGTPERPTPLLSDKIVNLKFSPDWTVPPTIAREDILPILEDAPELIEGMGIDVLDDKGARVKAASVNWSEINPRNIPFKFRMKPGLDNLLGGVRFSLTNDFAIYLHDSPERDLFGANVRGLSSGCVRVGDAPKLASWIMGRQKDWSRPKVIKAMVQEKSRIEVLPRPIQVDFIYSTVGFTETGSLKFMPDIYGEDRKLAKKIGLKAPAAMPPVAAQRPEV